MSEHTPGRLQNRLTIADKPSTFLNPGWTIVLDPDAHGQAVAYARTPELARLIAAAPELLAVLRALKVAVVEWAPAEANGLLHPQLEEVVDAARAAIRRATDGAA